MLRQLLFVTWPTAVVNRLILIVSCLPLTKGNIVVFFFVNCNPFKAIHICLLIKKYFITILFNIQSDILERSFSFLLILNIWHSLSLTFLCQDDILQYSKSSIWIVINPSRCDPLCYMNTELPYMLTLPPSFFISSQTWSYHSLGASDRSYKHCFSCQIFPSAHISASGLT